MKAEKAIVFKSVSPTETGWCESYTVWGPDGELYALDAGLQAPKNWIKRKFGPACQIIYEWEPRGPYDRLLRRKLKLGEKPYHQGRAKGR